MIQGVSEISEQIP